MVAGGSVASMVRFGKIGGVEMPRKTISKRISSVQTNRHNLFCEHIDTTQFGK